MRKEGNRPLSVPKKRKDTETKNYSTARNLTRKKANPIAVPFDPPSNAPSKSIVGKMKSSTESTNSQGGTSSLYKVGDRRKTKHTTSYNDRNIPTRQSSRSLTNKRGEKEVIEINSDQEDNLDSGEETPQPTVRKRRLIRPDSDSDDEGGIVRPTSSSTATPFQRKTVENDENLKRVANKLISNRIEIVEAERLAESQAAKALREEAKNKETINKARAQAIKRERERQKKESAIHTNSLISRYSTEHQLHSSSMSSSSSKEKTSSPPTFHQKLDIPIKRTKPTSSTSITPLQSIFSKSPSPYIEKRTPISIQESTTKTSRYFNLPNMMQDELRSLARSAKGYVKRKIFSQEHEFKEEKELDIKSKPVYGDIFDYDFDDNDDFKVESPTLPSTTTNNDNDDTKNASTTKRVSPPKKKLVEEQMKIELPHDPIDDDPLKPIGSDGHLLTYPFEGKKSVTVYERDLTRLDEDQYLNDTLLDVFPKIWDDDYATSKSTHTFSSFFYTRLAGDGNNVNYDKIGRWTANINIFEKSMIIIPVAQNYHWYLIVVTNPSRCIRNAEAYGLLNNDEDIDIDYIEEDRPPRVGRWKNQVPAGAMLNPKKAYIMLLDSLGGMKKETCTNISEYLKKEAMEKLNIQEDDFIEPEFVSAHCPTQKNFVDCGVFCLHYIKSLYQDPHRMMKVLYNHQKDDKGWDPDNTLPVYRQILRRILKKKMVKYREYLTGKLKEEVGYC